MKTRLAIFVAALLLLPLIGIWLTGADIEQGLSGEVNPPALLLTTLMLAGYIVWINHLLRRYTENNLLSLQRHFFWAMAAASAALGWLLVYLNGYVASWGTQSVHPVVALLLFTPLFALLAPAVLITRAVLGAMPNLLKRLAAGIPIPALHHETQVLLLIVLSALGLLAGAAWADQLLWLFWLSPLLLLVALQGLWHESTLFSGLVTGDWGRVVCSALAGTIVGNFVAILYQNNGGVLNILLPYALLNQVGFILFGCLCVQLGDVVAEFWRGKQRSDLFPTKKKFPIPVVVEKTGCRK
ncbi:MAG: hypothetical protein WAO71_07175 [Gallionella sp.]